MNYKIFFILVFLIFPSTSFSDSIKTYSSPDKTLLASVLYKDKEAGNTINITKQDEKLICSKNLTFEKGYEGGEVVYKAKWTKNSQFFVFSTMLSGGHQPWRATTYFYSSRTNSIYKLDDFIGTIGDPDFNLDEPDIINTKLYKFENGDLEKISVKLNDIVDNKLNKK